MFKIKISGSCYRGNKRENRRPVHKRRRLHKPKRQYTMLDWTLHFCVYGLCIFRKECCC